MSYLSTNWWPYQYIQTAWASWNSLLILFAGSQMYKQIETFYQENTLEFDIFFTVCIKHHSKDIILETSYLSFYIVPQFCTTFLVKLSLFRLKYALEHTNIHCIMLENTDFYLLSSIYPKEDIPRPFSRHSLFLSGEWTWTFSAALIIYSTIVSIINRLNWGFQLAARCQSGLTVDSSVPIIVRITSDNPATWTLLQLTSCFDLELKQMFTKWRNNLSFLGRHGRLALLSVEFVPDVLGG